MSLEWFDRVSSEMQDYLESICEDYDEIGHMRIDRAAKHPKIEFYVEFEEDDREVFCTLFFDPHNEEFYIEEFDLTMGETYRQILPDIEEILDAIHEVFHEFMDTEVEEIEEDEENEDLFDDEDENQVYTDGGEYDVVVDVEWTTPEVLAYSYLDEVEVTYKFGVIKETGDGILHRINRIYTEDDETIEDETNFIFSKEEAGAIIELIENNMDSMEGFDPS
ncbi:hypothetical protein AWH56_023600 [Anaerobacillus isosaccharinicus]|uniref:Uncharacterized protein n=1 Tax=Anaerobacillus isosaccharinicus TaxID=1532552 RepID=A0A1S2LHY6_9BACI|nr:hypothetical protein [Anaerobacillus isosaccharinicus]MBA5586110.1 hypothetical protein [Anaerobacillus isosaccharinicus]QOY35622.1 hypothetical protein AWH56_023600 [Anaerobacillus isosaccharinicus]